MFCFGLCFPKATEAVNSKITDQRFSDLIGYQMRSFMQNNSAVLITKPQSPKTVSSFSFISIGYLFIDLSSSTLKNSRNLLR